MKFPLVESADLRRGQSIRLEQILFRLNRSAIPTKQVNLLEISDVERIHTIGLNRMTVQSNRDPL
jgi:hypothetical protein